MLFQTETVKVVAFSITVHHVPLKGFRWALLSERGALSDITAEFTSDWGLKRFTCSSLNFSLLFFLHAPANHISHSESLSILCEVLVSVSVFPLIKANFACLSDSCNTTYPHSSPLFDICFYPLFFVCFSSLLSFLFKGTKLGQLAWTPKTTSCPTLPMQSPRHFYTFLTTIKNWEQQQTRIKSQHYTKWHVFEHEQETNLISAEGGAWSESGGASVRSSWTGVPRESGHGRGTTRWGQPERATGACVTSLHFTFPSSPSCHSCLYEEK